MEEEELRWASAAAAELVAAEVEGDESEDGGAREDAEAGGKEEIDEAEVGDLNSAVDEGDSPAALDVAAEMAAEPPVWAREVTEGPEEETGAEDEDELKAATCRREGRVSRARPSSAAQQSIDTRRTQEVELILSNDEPILRRCSRGGRSGRRAKG